MTYYRVKDILGDIVWGKYPTLDLAHSAALKFLMRTKISEYRVVVEPHAVHFYSPNGAKLLTAELPPTYGYGRKEYTECQVLAGAGKPRKPAEFKIAGRPTVSGWCKCQTRVELDLDATEKFIGLLPPAAYYLVYMDLAGQPLEALLIDRVTEEATNLLHADNRRGASVDKVALSQKMAMSMLLETPPPTAVALFIVKVEHGHLDALCKRPLKGAAAAPYVRAKVALSSSGGRLTTDYSAWDALIEEAKQRELKAAAKAAKPKRGRKAPAD